MRNLSGGERARVLIAKLMLEPADVLLLDEPTNDLDIPTLEILEENLLDFPGALVLVTHDRYLLNRVSSTVLGLDGRGNTGRFADYAQWEDWLEEQDRIEQNGAVRTIGGGQTVRARRSEPELSCRQLRRKKKLSYLEAREFAAIEEAGGGIRCPAGRCPRPRRGSCHCHRCRRASGCARGTGRRAARKRRTLRSLGRVDRKECIDIPSG